MLEDCLKMALFKETRNILLESYIDGVIDEDEFLLIYDANFSVLPSIQNIFKN